MIPTKLINKKNDFKLNGETEELIIRNPIKTGGKDVERVENAVNLKKTA